MEQPRSSRRLDAKFHWSRGLIPGWVHLSQGRVLSGVLSLLFFATLTIGIIGLAVVAIVKPELLASAAVTSTSLQRIFYGILTVGVLYFWASVSSLRRLRKDRRFTKSRFGVFVLASVLAIQCAGFAAAATGINVQRKLIDSLFIDATSLGNNTDPSAPSASQRNLTGRLNILLLGGDAGVNRWGLRPDSISVVNIDFETGRIMMIGLPRNLEKARFSADSPMLKPFPNGFDCGHTCLINAIYTYATGHSSLYSDSKYAGKDVGIQAMREAVQGTLGISIDYYVLIDMHGFSRLVDAVGGVNIDVPLRVVTQYGRVYEKGCQHMTGSQALLYARTRKDSSDYNRMAKQRLVQESLLRQIEPLDLFRAYSELANNGSQYISTDTPQDVVADLLRVGLKSKSASFKSLELVPPTISVVNPNIAHIHELVQTAIITGVVTKAPPTTYGSATATPKPLAPGQTLAKTTPCS